MTFFSRVVPYRALLCFALLWSVSLNSVSQARENDSSENYTRDNYPIVFAHGVGVPWALYEALPLKKLFKALGYDFYVARTPRAGSIEERAKILRDEILRLVPTGKYHLVGHSMGGLDARLVVHSDVGRRCVSITTMATPHHGSFAADFVLSHLGEIEAQNGILKRVIEQVFAGDLRAVRELTTEHMDHVFNQEVQDQPWIQYFSLSFYIPEPIRSHSLVPMFWALSSIVSPTRESRGNDGLVSVESSVWGKSIGLAAADHWSETAPVPFVDGKSYKEIFSHVAENLDNLRGL